MEGRPGADFSRRGLLSVAFAGAAATAFGVAASRAHASVPQGRGLAVGSSSRVRPLVGTDEVPSSWVAKPFPLADVQLAPSLFTANRDRMLGFVGSFPMDRMLYNFRKNAGLDTQGAQPLDSWEDPTSLLRGHFTGHYLSALAQAHAGAAGEGRGAVTIEWTDINELTPMRFALANAVGEPIPDPLLDGAGSYYSRAAATAPMLGLPRRIAASDLAAREGILSSAALVDLYSQAYTEEDLEGPAAALAIQLRQAYVGADAAARAA